LDPHDGQQGQLGVQKSHGQPNEEEESGSPLRFAFTAPGMDEAQIEEQLAISAPPAPPALGPNNEPATAQLGNCGVMEENWASAYDGCYWFGELWRATQDPAKEWPWGVQVDHGKLYQEGKLCIPSELVPRVIRAHHAAIGHPGVWKLWLHICHRYAFLPRAKASKLCRTITQQCGTCQASKEPNLMVHTKVQPTAIPARLGESIALDIFNLPSVVHHGERHDCMVVAVDRLSGWTVAIPACRKGLQAKKVAQEMWERWWQPFGIPATFTSDQGPQFVGAWWRTLCAAMGVRQVYSQAYHHSANGRAEMAGKTLQQLLRRLHQEEHLSWVEVLPRAVQQLHDLPGPSCLSPYEVMFGGRMRCMGGITRQLPNDAPDARYWLEQGQVIDSAVAEKLRTVHQQRLQSLNETRRPKPTYKVGEKVWLLRPRHVGTDKLQSWWIGPCPVTARRGAESYVVEDKPGHERAVHSSQLKPFLEDEFADNPTTLHHFRQTEEDLTDEVYEWEVDKICGHKTDESGQLWFLTKWVGFEAPTWEPLGNFVHRYSVDWAEYCKEHKVNANVIEHLLGSRAQVRALAAKLGVPVAHTPQTCGGRAESSRNTSQEPPTLICAQ